MKLWCYSLFFFHNVLICVSASELNTHTPSVYIRLVSVPPKQKLVLILDTHNVRTRATVKQHRHTFTLCHEFQLISICMYVSTHWESCHLRAKSYLAWCSMKICTTYFIKLYPFTQLIELFVLYVCVLQRFYSRFSINVDRHKLKCKQTKCQPIDTKKKKHERCYIWYVLKLQLLFCLEFSLSTLLIWSWVQFASKYSRIVHWMSIYIYVYVFSTLNLIHSWQMRHFTIAA